MAHIHEKIDFTVDVFIVFKNKVLLRKHDKYGIWLGVGGHIELDEDPNQAAVREVKEEVGLEVTLVGNPKPTVQRNAEYLELIPPKYLNRHGVSTPGHEHISFIYFATTGSDTVIPENTTDAWVWFTQEDLEKNVLALHEDIRFYAQTALKELST